MPRGRCAKWGTLNPVDITFALVLFLALWRGYAKGLLGTAAGYLAPVAGFMIASDFSDPVRAQLASRMTVPEIVLDMLAPVVLFFAVVIVVRLTAAVFGSLLGVGLSLPGRLLGGVAGMAVCAVVLGSGVLIVRQLVPERVQVPNSTGQRLVSPAEDILVTVDRQMGESWLAPPLAELADSLLSESLQFEKKSPMGSSEKVDDVARRATEAAVAAVVNLSESTDEPAGEKPGSAPSR